MNTFYRLLGFLRPYKRGLMASWALASLAMVVTVLIPHFTGSAVEAIKHGDNHARHHELALRSHDRHTLLVLALVIVAIVLVRWLLTYMRRMIAGRISLAIEFDLREIIYAQLQRLELGFFDHQQTGQLMSRATVDLQAVRFFLGYGLVFILQSILTLLLAGIAMIVINPGLGLIAMAPTPFVVFISQRYGRTARPAIQEVQQRIGELTADAEENISGVRVVKSFAREPQQLQRFRHSVSRVFEQSMVATRLEAKFNPAIGFLPQLGLAAVLLIGGNRVIHAHLTIGQFTQFYLYLNMLIGPMRSLGVTLGLAQRATASGQRIFQVLDREPRIVAPADAPPLPPGNGHVEFRDVTLRYDEGDDFGAVHAGPRELSLDSDSDGNQLAARVARPVLSDVSLDVRAGTTVALVGATGSGKTSLVSLISRLYDTSKGAVLLDGADVRSVDLASLRHAVAVVSDDPFLFSASVAENIAYGRPDASRDEVEAARAGLRLRRAPAARLRHARRRARALALRRAAPAPRDRPRAARRPARLDPRRRDLRRRRFDRAEHQARARRGDGRAHDLCHRAPPLDDLARR
jgi:ABC-type multidrug transport system fused ATPase/permease subunit